MSDAEKARREAGRRRRRAEVFGDVPPEVTSDDRPDHPDGPEGSGGTPDEWWRRQVPPHHG